ncbi:phage tail protein [Nocardioides gilvus]|uniref:phage tail protein n=1 Tax=Nocardioides gilvus TaxID=1735589 RepID=UPI000D7472E8|nr:phage tail protein [Nocardioides gilvus]
MADVNGSSFHLLLTEQDWFTRVGESGTPPVVSGDPEPDLEWTPTCGLRLRRTVPFDRTESLVRLQPDDRRGSDRDVDGVFWHVGEDAVSLWRTDEGDATRYWPPRAAVGAETFSPCTPSMSVPTRLGAVVATRDRWLVVGLLDTPGPGLLLLDLLGGGDPVVRDWSAWVPDFRPVEACRRPDGGLLVLDALPGRAEPTRIWPLDSRADPELLIATEVEAPVFDRCAELPPDESEEGDTGSDEVEEPAVVGLPVPWVLPLQRAVSVVALDDASYLVLDLASRQVVRFEGEARAGHLDLDIALAGRLTDPTADPAVRGHDIAVVRDTAGRSILFVSDAGGDEVFTFDVDDDFAPLAEHFPMRRHHGRGLVSDGESVWFDTARRWHPLVTRGRSRHRSWGTVVTSEFDGHERGCRWHRVLIDGRLPSSTSLRVETRAADDFEALAGMPWRLEPTPYRRRDSRDPGDSSDFGDRVDPEAPGTWETLVQHTDGRFCQLRVTLESAGGATPEIAALRLVAPRFSYLHAYLPQVYAQEDAPTRFLERYLANPEGLLSDLEGRIADVDLLFDARTSPARYLDWLNSWLGSVFDSDLDERRRRLFLTHATRLFARRGTPGGLVAMLRLVLDECPEAAFDDVADDPTFIVRIAERYLSRSVTIPLPGGPTETRVEGPDEVAATDRWVPGLGSSELHQRFREALVARHGPDWSSTAIGVPDWLRGRTPDEVEISPLTPVAPDAKADWVRFLGGQLGLRTVSLTDAHLPLWRRFLLQRHERIERLVSAHQMVPAPSSFDAVGWPDRLPAFGPGLEDWTAMVSLVVPIAESAHRFSVLLPVDLETPEGEQLRLLERARRVVEQEKPAHTVFDVRPYWAAFQLGDARLGVDTRLGAGARRAALVLNRSRLTQAGLAPPTTHTASCGCDHD